MNLLKKNAALGEGDSIYVIGLSPNNFRAGIYAGYIEDGMWKMHQLKRQRVASIYPNDGYIVLKGEPGVTYALIEAGYAIERGSFSGFTRYVCSGSALTFELSANKALYITDVQFSTDGKSIGIKGTDNFDAARNYIDANYPSLKGQLERGNSKSTYVKPYCASGPSFIFIPSR